MIAQATPPAPTLEVIATPNPVGQNDYATFTVNVDPGQLGETVTLEQKVLGLLWTAVDTEPLDADNKAQFRVKLSIIASYQYRAKVASNATHTAGTSSVVVLDVVKDATPYTVPGSHSCASQTPTVAHPGGGSWQCTYNDEFNSMTLDTTYWHVATAGHMPHPKADPACYGDQGSGNVSLDGDHLLLTASVKAAATDCPGPSTRTSRKFGATVWHNIADGTSPTLQQVYGYYEVRAKLPGYHGTSPGNAIEGKYIPDLADLPTDATAGLQETFYLWPTNDRYGFHPYSGEIDFAEFYSKAGNLAKPAFHYPGEGSNIGGWGHEACNITSSYGGNPGGFNTYKFLWTPTTLTTWVNNNPTPCTEVTIGQPFDRGFYLVLMQAYGVAATANDYALPAAPYSNANVGTTEIDYVRVWQ
ncbi:glycosyl hydrolase family protein [Nocardioides marmoriginsengisoli]|uniref:Glycosyl hydrolase family protein n=1 Tax=Nocardioides marmoriginsengisoli TaxID=661483 RepID=A0A3N0CEY1_9ACTN|nr:family 16 glycosylhydrolase [Nocardioides marmoriginsengisoli]RNL62017.1 glycosyl hydrolase family protein [Nocardioides marmoriginsengisoli]